MSRKQIFKGKTLYRTRVVNNIVKVYENPTFNFKGDWYKEASELATLLSGKYNINYFKVCGIIAALSPLKSWDENKRIAIIFLQSQKQLHTKRMHNKAVSILNTDYVDDDSILDILGGNKIQNFYLNIAYPSFRGAVTIDRHAISVCLNRSITNKEGIGLTDIQYNFLKLCYIEAASILNTRPSMVQSITWEKWRELKKTKLN